MFMAAPVVLAAILLSAIALLVFLGWLGGTASGERVEITFTSSCMTEAHPIITARVNELGLGEPILDVSSTEMKLIATLPGLENDKTFIPVLLSQPGRLKVLADEDVLATEADLKSASLDLDDAGMPVVKIVFVPTVHDMLATHIDGNPRDSLSIWIDDQDELIRPNSVKLGAEMKMVSMAGDTREQMKHSADRTILLQHGPMPCEVNVRSVVEASVSE